MLEVEKVMAYMKLTPNTWHKAREITQAIESPSSSKVMKRTLLYLSKLGGIKIRKQRGYPHLYQYKSDVVCIAKCQQCGHTVDVRSLSEGLCGDCRPRKSTKKMQADDVKQWRANRDQAFISILRLPFGQKGDYCKSILQGDKSCH